MASPEKASPPFPSSALLLQATFPSLNVCSVTHSLPFLYYFMKEQIWQQLILYTIEKGSGFESVVPTVAPWQGFDYSCKELLAFTCGITSL